MHRIPLSLCTVHGGIRGMWDGLGYLKAGLNKRAITVDSEAKGSRVDKLLVDTSAAWSKGNDALLAMEHLVNYGLGSQVAAPKGEPQEMAKGMRGLE